MQSFIYDDIKWNKTKIGYYICDKTKHQKKQMFHRYLWEKYNGSIPDGYVIHHIDHNKENNNLNNLKCMKRDEHNRYHALIIFGEDIETICEICGKHYIAKTNRAKFCSFKCKNKATKEYRNEWNKNKSKKMIRKNHNGMTNREYDRQQNEIKILELRNEGKKQREIAEELGVTQQYVSKVLKK